MKDRDRVEFADLPDEWVPEEDPNFTPAVPRIPENPQTEIIDPQTSEVVSTADADQLIDAWERSQEMLSTVMGFRRAIAGALSALTTDVETKTRRVRGQRRRCKIEMPDSSWDQSRLKEAWHAYPQFRDEFLTIGTLRPKLREVRKMLAESGPVEFETFKRLIEAADRGPQGTPNVKVEE